MKKMKISVTKEPVENAMVSCKQVKISKKIFKKIFGEKATVTIITPGSSVKSIEICEAKVGGSDNATIKT